MIREYHEKVTKITNKRHGAFDIRWLSLMEEVDVEQVYDLHEVAIDGYQYFIILFQSVDQVGRAIDNLLRHHHACDPLKSGAPFRNVSPMVGGAEEQGSMSGDEDISQMVCPAALDSCGVYQCLDGARHQSLKS